MNNGWNLIEKYVDKRTNLELQFIELFILTITAEIVVISISEYKTIVVPVLINIVAVVIYLVFMLIYDLNLKKTHETVKELAERAALTVAVPLGVKDMIPLLLYIASIIVMGVIILIPFVNSKPWSLCCSSL